MPFSAKIVNIKLLKKKKKLWYVPFLDVTLRFSTSSEVSLLKGRVQKLTFPCPYWGLAVTVQDNALGALQWNKDSWAFLCVSTSPPHHFSALSVIPDLLVGLFNVFWSKFSIFFSQDPLLITGIVNCKRGENSFALPSWRDLHSALRIYSMFHRSRPNLTRL